MVDYDIKKYTWEEVKYELDLSIEMARVLIAHQAKGKEYAVWEDLVDELRRLNSKSKISQHFDWWEGWVEENRNNKLPNSSSGSFFTGLTDLDGLLTAMNFEIENVYSDDFYTKVENYYDRTLKQEVPDMFKY